MSTKLEDKIINRVRKLLALANDKGATEAEAALAAERAAEIMEEYGLEMARVEASGGTVEAREKAAMESARGAWYGPLMKTVAESCFCTAFFDEDHKRVRFVLIGRRSAVASTRVTYEYLRAAIWRLSREAEQQNGPGFSARWFRHGCAERVIERLHERHERVLREQREQAERQKRETEARASHPGAAPSGTALSIVLGDWEQQEQDLNEDCRRGVSPGTTARERAEREARYAARDARYAALRDDGVPDDVAWRMAYMGVTREEAERAEAAAAEHRRLEAQKKPRAARSSERAWQAHTRREEAAARKRGSAEFRSGRAAGERVGLAQQLGKMKPGRPTYPRPSLKIRGE